MVGTLESCSVNIQIPYFTHSHGYIQAVALCILYCQVLYFYFIDLLRMSRAFWFFFVSYFIVHAAIFVSLWLHM